MALILPADTAVPLIAPTLSAVGNAAETTAKPTEDALKSATRLSTPVTTLAEVTVAVRAVSTSVALIAVPSVTMEPLRSVTTLRVLAVTLVELTAATRVVSTSVALTVVPSVIMEPLRSVTTLTLLLELAEPIVLATTKEC